MGSRVYFAHPMVDYDTAREAFAVLAIRDFMVRIGTYAEVVNPNKPEHQAGYDALVAAGDPDPFRYWTELAVSCDGIAFMCMPGKDRPIGSGVAQEVESALGMGRYEVWEIGRQDLRLHRLDYMDHRALAEFRNRRMSIPDTKMVTHLMREWRAGR